MQTIALSGARAHAGHDQRLPARGGQSPLRTPAAFARCIMESLVLRYGEVLRQLQHLTGNTIESVHIVGGGARNTRLNQWLGELRSLADMRAIACSVPTQTFTPRADHRGAWDEAAARFGALRAARKG